MQDIRKEKPAYADKIYRPPTQPTETPTQITPGKITDLDIYSLEWGINLYFEENFPHQEGVISEIH